MSSVVASRRSHVIRKSVESSMPVPNLLDYEEACRSFRWDSVRGAELDGLPGGRGLNIAHEAIDRHALGPVGDRVAFRWLGLDNRVRELTYRELREATNRVANGLVKLGMEPGDRIFLLAGRIPELYLAALGALKARLVVSPLFAAFGPDPILTRMSLGGGRALLTTPSLYERKVAPVRDALPRLEHVLLAGAEEGDVPDGTLSFDALVRAESPDYDIPPTDPADPALLHFTSGTTGRPKGALHVHDAVVAHHITGKLALDLHPGDRFWCTADPGWVTGTSYGIISPLTNAVTSVVDEAEFDVERWYGILQDHRINVWYTSPTAVRMLMRAGGDLAKGFDLSALRFVASVGEALNPEAVVWGEDVLGLPIHDNWWQTETGGIMIANYRSMDVRPGSMGRPLPGVEAAIVRRVGKQEGDGAGDGGETAEDAQVEIVGEPGVEGELALLRGWPSMFRTYVGEEERYRRCFAGDWYLTGDLCRRDGDGYFWFVGRVDDVIKSAGHLIGPFEVESALIEHPAVAEAAVIGIPDPTVGEVVKAFVSLKAGCQPSEELQLELLGHARKRLGPAVAPRTIEFRERLPRTRSGKIMRRLVKARELGLPEGDISTLESETVEQTPAAGGSTSGTDEETRGTRRGGS
jgi:acetyl-CoA synthetase